MMSISNGDCVTGGIIVVMLLFLYSLHPYSFFFLVGLMAKNVQEAWIGRRSPLFPSRDSTTESIARHRFTSIAK